METNSNNRNFCLEILTEFTQSDSLLKHAFAVESCVRFYSEKFGKDVEYWGNVALLHDFDYEMFPDEHPYKGSEILKEKNFDEIFIKAIMSHADYTGVKRETLLEKTLFACDELAGFITAVTYVRPNKNLDEVEVKSVIKKMKDKGFAKNVNRDDIINGAIGLEIPLDEHIQNCINAMKRRRDLLGI